MLSSPAKAAKLINELVPSFKPKVAIILGSGLGPLADEIEDAKVIPYEDIPNFPSCTVAGHSGELYLGKLGGVPVACMRGRAHFYEGYSHFYEDLSTERLLTPLRTLKLLGCEMLLATNAVGSMREEIHANELVLIKDHINFQFNNPLVGTSDGEFGSPFVSMDDAYDLELRKQFLELAKNLNIKLHEGVLFGVLGPTFETPAEVNAFRILGGDVAGMSIVPETIIARQANMRVSVISVVTNMASGMSEEKVTHELTLRGAKESIQHLIQLVMAFLESQKQYQESASKNTV